MPDRTQLQDRASRRLAGAGQLGLAPLAAGACEELVELNWGWVDFLCLLGLAGLLVLMAGALSWKLG